MSEIFDFLKKAAAERRKGSLVLSDEPLVEFQTPEIVEPSIEEYEAAEPFPTTKFEIRHAGKFDLTGASPQIQNVLDPQFPISTRHAQPPAISRLSSLFCRFYTSLFFLIETF